MSKYREFLSAGSEGLQLRFNKNDSFDKYTSDTIQGKYVLIDGSFLTMYYEQDTIDADIARLDQDTLILYQHYQRGEESFESQLIMEQI